ncbi:UNKNOWN [Stylonychia lemnae]|uniref:Uncharacterized protein n=1 Tax=Stylonychia lemnae TaxID=5949 RepID=A0A077ZX85_STYLE|nr:UNKNOWN [Stylonychia lemnae]|eukprot:CDW73146.1 UNKNOWN [Stylonychia lemnae]
MESEKQSMSQRLITRLSGKNESYKYITSLESISPNSELFKAAQTRNLFAVSFDKAMGQAKDFCTQISTLKLMEFSNQNKSQIDIQAYANQQNEAEECYVQQLNKYLDSMNALGSRYAVCKQECFDKDPQLKREYEIRQEQQGKKSEFFNAMSTNMCLTQCRQHFYFTFKRTSNYFSDKKGFYIESSKDYY